MHIESDTKLDYSDVLLRPIHTLKELLMFSLLLLLTWMVLALLIWQRFLPKTI
jgi:hypothetical protein